jgi:DNA-binding MarR family transcriptional regulator
MGSRNKWKRSNKSFVMLGRGMLLRSQEWKELSPAAKLAYLYIKAKFNGSNNGSIRLYYSELKGVKGLSSHSTISKALKELEAKEWIKRTIKGGLYRHFNEFKLTGKYDDHIS